MKEDDDKHVIKIDLQHKRQSLTNITEWTGCSVSTLVYGAEDCERWEGCNCEHFHHDTPTIHVQGVR